MDENAQLHVQLLLKQKAALREASKRKGQLPKNRPTKTAVVQRFMMNLAQSFMQSSAGWHTVRTSFIPPPYLPCTKPLCELQKILIRNLRLETSHRGSFLLARVLTPPDRMTGIIAIVEDEKDDVMLLQLYQQEDENLKPAVEILSPGMVVVVKEPYFKQTSDGGYGLRVDHVGDILWLRQGNEMIPGKWAPRFTDLDKTAMMWKEEGNRAVARKEFWKSIECYTSALECPASSEEIRVIRLNRAYSYLQTGHFDSVLCDVFYPFMTPINTQPEKTLFRAAKALYFLNRFRECSKILAILQQENPQNSSAKLELARVITRLIEQEKGKYNFKGMLDEAEKLRPPHLDHATYIGPVQVRESKGRGRGLFLTKSVRAGDLLICAKAFAYSYAASQVEKDQSGSSRLSLLVDTETDFIKFGTNADLIKNVVQKLHKNPSLANDFTALHHGQYQTTLSTESVDGVPVIDSFLISRIIQFNAFGSSLTTLSSHLSGPGSSKEDTKFKQDIETSSGVWILPSYINHSCTGNCRRSFIGDMQIIRSTCDMPANTELFFPYLSLPTQKTSYEDRQKELQSWKFTCSCDICEYTKNADKKLVKKREELNSDLERAFGRKEKIDHRKLDTAKIERLLGAMENCYKGMNGKNIPKIAIWERYLAMTRVYAMLGQTQKVVWGVAKTLEMLLFEVSGLMRPKEPLVMGKWGLVTDYLVECWLLLCTSYVILGQGEKAEVAKDLAIVSYRIIVGEDETFEEVYGSKAKNYIAEGMLWNGL